MRKSLLSVLLLSTVALSTSEVLPILAIKQVEPEIDSSDDQVNENILSNRFHNDDISKDILYKVSIGSPHEAYTPLLIPQKSNVVYVSENNQNEDVDSNHINQKGNRDDEGFRKEQWHNYPRQLDRLQKYLFRHHQFDTVLDSEPDDPDDMKNIYEIATNEMNRPIDKDEHDILDTVVAASPLLILKIRLAYLKNDLQNTNLNENIDTVPIELVPDSIIDEKDQQIIDPIISAIKVKREGISNTKGTGFSEKATHNKKTVKKRIFSLWSRLQSLSHKGHELQHRRHLHAFYGFPDDSSGGGGGTLTAETRASFIRPPGSPLRWG